MRIGLAANTRVRAYAVLISSRVGSSRIARIAVAQSTVYRALRRLGLGTRKERLGLLESHSAERAGLFTQRTRKQLEKARPTPSRRHVEAKTPGELVCLDCFFIGQLKGVGKLWQVTACDAASSFALAQVFVGPPRAKVIADFLRKRVIPFFRKAGHPLQRVLAPRLPDSRPHARFDRPGRKRRMKSTEEREKLSRPMRHRTR